MRLAQLGAEVIRVDPEGSGPDVGRWPVADSGTSMYWTGRGWTRAKTMAADFRSPEGRLQVTDLITQAGASHGILLTNAAGQDFLDDAVLRARRPDMIHVRIRVRALVR